GGPLDRRRRRFLPRLGARSDQLDDLIDAVRHVQVSGVSGPTYFLVTVSSRSTFLENQNTSRATIRKSTVAPSTGLIACGLLDGGAAGSDQAPPNLADASRACATSGCSAGSQCFQASMNRAYWVAACCRSPRRRYSSANRRCTRGKYMTSMASGNESSQRCASASRPTCRSTSARTSLA